MARERREARDSPNLARGRWRFSVHGGIWRARGGKWVGPGGAREGEKAKGVETGLGVALDRRGRGAPWTGAPARSLPLLGVMGARVCVSGAFVEMVYGQGKGEKERGELRVEP